MNNPFTTKTDVAEFFPQFNHVPTLKTWIANNSQDFSWNPHIAFFNEKAKKGQIGTLKINSEEFSFEDVQKPEIQTELTRRFNAERGFCQENWDKMVQDRKNQVKIWKKMATSSVQGKWNQNQVVFVDKKTPSYKKLTTKDSDGYFGFQKVGRSYWIEKKLQQVTSIGPLKNLEGQTGFFWIEFWNGGVGFGSGSEETVFEGTLGGVETEWKRRPSDGIRKSFSWAWLTLWFHKGTEAVPSALTRAGLPVEPIQLYPEDK